MRIVSAVHVKKSLMKLGHFARLPFCLDLTSSGLLISSCLPFLTCSFRLKFLLAIFLKLLTQK